ncbi:hypothetical protein [Streptomyces glaucus]|uniref:Secreted protein n=1 Tax=Streptomyces glaucus TaxID=284029 RepID=A0ABN3JXQ3_9ACTN
MSRPRRVLAWCAGFAPVVAVLLAGRRSLAGRVAEAAERAAPPAAARAATAPRRV